MQACLGHWLHIKVIDSDGLRRAMSQVKWPTPNPSGSTTVDLIHGPAADLLWLAVKNLPSYIAIEPLLSFLKDMFFTIPTHPR